MADFYQPKALRMGGAESPTSPMAVSAFTPIIHPWIEKAFYNCMTDTLYFDDHSILNHEGAAWHWESSAPEK